MRYIYLSPPFGPTYSFYFYFFFLDRFFALIHLIIAHIHIFATQGGARDEVPCLEIGHRSLSLCQ